MATAKVTFRMSAEDQANPKLAVLYRQMCLVVVVQNVRCPGCKAQPGEGCKSTSGKTARPHVLRTNLAKHEAVRGAFPIPARCPIGCGDWLALSRGRIYHVESGLFECLPEGADRG